MAFPISTFPAGLLFPTGAAPSGEDGRGSAAAGTGKLGIIDFVIQGGCVLKIHGIGQGVLGNGLHGKPRNCIFTIYGRLAGSMISQRRAFDLSK